MTDIEQIREFVKGWQDFHIRGMKKGAAAYHQGAVAVCTEILTGIDNLLAESEDESIRKLLVWQVYRNIEDETNDLAKSVYDGIKGHDPDLEESIEDWKKCLAWLEKQKNLDKMIVVSPEVWDKAIADAYENGKKDGEKQKEQKVDIDKLRRDLYQSGYNDGYQHGKEDAQKEQKPSCWNSPVMTHEMIMDEQKPILEVFGFKVGDKVRLKDGDGRTHIIKKFEKIEGVHGPDFYQVEFEDNSARDGIYPGEEYPNGYYTQMEKIKEEQKPVQSDDEREYVRVLKSLISDFIRDNYKTTDINFYQRIYDWLDGRHIEQKPAEWQKEQEKDEWLKDREGCFWDGVEEGKRAMEKQMMKDAVEGEVVKDLHGKLHVKTNAVSDILYQFGDKVKVIILPKK